MLRSFVFVLFPLLVLWPHDLVAQGLSEAWVCPTGDCGHGTSGFNSIQQGVNAVVSGGVVHIAGGTYFESILIQSPITLKGEGADRVVLQSNSSVDCITIRSSQVAIDGLTFAGGRNGLFGEMTNSSVRHCSFQGFLLDGIHLVNSDMNLIEGNTIVGNATATAGVSLLDSRNNSIAGNTASGSSRNIYIAPDAGRTSYRNVIHGNTLIDPQLWSVELNADAATTKINSNVFKTNGTNDRYIRNACSGIVNAQYNWFGGENPPQASDFSGGVDYTHYIATNMTVFMFPTIQYMKPSDEVDVYVLGLVPVGVQVRGTTMTVGWNNSVTALQGTPTQGSFYTQKLVGVQQEFFAFDPLAPTNTVTVDQSLMGGSTGAGNLTGIPYVGLFYILKFRGLTTGISTLSLSNVLVRDPNNNPIPSSVVAPTQIYVDGQPPNVSDFIIDNTTLNTDENGDSFDDYLKNSDNVTITATITDNNPISAAGFCADLSGFYGGSGHTTDPPNFFAANVATWLVNNVNCSPGNGTITVTITAADTVGNVATSSRTIVADNIPPTKILNFTATPGHKKITLHWSDPGGNDTHYKGAAIRFNQWNDYPLFGVASPSYPSTPTSGIEAFGAASGTGAVHPFPTPSRDVYYYTAFAVDWAGNYSPADAASQDRSTNYYLGDLGSGNGAQIPGDGYDGRVNFDDLIWFSNLYLWHGAWPYPSAAEADFAPTVGNKTYSAGSSLAIPAPDGRVDFEELIIFSFNYLTVAPKITPPPSSNNGSELALALIPSGINSNEVQVRVHLSNNGTRVKGCSVSIRFDQSRVHFLGATNGDVFGSQGQGLYFIKLDDGKLQVDATVLGIDRTADFSGDVAVLRFNVVQGGEESILINHASIRDEKNSNVGTILNSTPEKLPTSFSLNQNYPNPFNPSTTITFELPVASDISIEVVNILGEVVARLADGQLDAGYHKAMWDGIDQHGTGAATGVYLMRMKAGNFTAVRKLMLIR